MAAFNGILSSVFGRLQVNTIGSPVKVFSLVALVFSVSCPYADAIKISNAQAPYMRFIDDLPGLLLGSVKMNPTY